jgi:hypothetical protein
MRSASGRCASGTSTSEHPIAATPAIMARPAPNRRDAGPTTSAPASDAAPPTAKIMP